jgi:anti-sigma B factor antagonist
MADSSIISIVPHDEIVLAVVECERMDENSAQVTQTEVSAAAEQAAQLPVVLDLAKVDFMPSLSLGALVNLQRGCKKRNQRFILAGLHGAVRSTFAITRLDKLFDICDSTDAALKHIRESS